MTREQHDAAGQYWLWRLQEDVRGPFAAVEIRAMARRGELVSGDRVALVPGQWVRAGRVTGLIVDQKPDAMLQEITGLLASEDEGLIRLGLAKVRAMGARVDIHLVQRLIAVCLESTEDEDEALIKNLKLDVCRTVVGFRGVWGRIGKLLQATVERDERPDAGSVLQSAEQHGGPRRALEVALALSAPEMELPEVAWALLSMNESEGGWHRQALDCLSRWSVIEAGNSVGAGERIVPLGMLRSVPESQLAGVWDGSLADPDELENDSLSVVIVGDGKPLDSKMANRICSWIPPQLWQELRLLDCPGEFWTLLKGRADLTEYEGLQGLEVRFERCGSVVGAGQGITEWEFSADVEAVGTVRFENCPRIDRDFIRFLAPKVHGTLAISGALAMPDLSGIVCPSIDCVRLEKIPISEIPAWLVDGTVFPGLTELFVEDCGLVSLGSARWNLPALRRLRLDGNALSGLGGVLRDLSTLDTLELAENRIVRIDPGQVPDAAFATTDRSLINLTGNPLAHCPELPYAENTSLKGTALEMLPAPTKGVSHLKELQVSRALVKLPSWLRQATALEDLQVGDSGVRELPEWLWQLSNLRALGAEGLRGVRVAMAQAWVDADTEVPIRVDLENCTFAAGCTGPVGAAGEQGAGGGAGNHPLEDQDDELLLDPDGTDAEELVLDLDALGLEEPDLHVLPDSDSFEIDLDELGIPAGSGEDSADERETDLQDEDGEHDEEEDEDGDDDDDEEEADEAAPKPAEYAISLSGTPITAVPEWLRHVPLRELKLDRVSVRQLPEWAQEWTRLREFEAAGSALESLPEWIGAWSACELIDVSTTLVAALPDAIGRLSQLQVLCLDGCPLTRLPDSISQCTELSSLKLEGTRITELPRGLGALASLSLLELSGTALTSLPDWIGEMRGLQTLGLDRTGLECLPGSIGQLTQLSTLSLSGSVIREIPREIESCRMLTEIRLHEVRSLSPESVDLLERLADRVEISVDTDGPLAHLARRT